MNIEYRDIIERAGPPDWWSPGGVPRYGEMSPDEIDVYATQAAFYRIRCQGCGEPFIVAASWSLMQATMEHMNRVGAIEDVSQLALTSIRAQLEQGEGLSYGDPPNIRCCPPGPTMSSEFSEVIAYYERKQGTLEWIRVPEVEVKEGAA